MLDIQNWIAMVIVALAVGYVLRAASAAWGLGTGQSNSGCGGCGSCSGGGPGLVEIGLGSASRRD